MQPLGYGPVAVIARIIVRLWPFRQAGDGHGCEYDEDR